MMPPVLYDRRIPRSRANLDHLGICPTGVLIADAKRDHGYPHLRTEAS